MHSSDRNILHYLITCLVKYFNMVISYVIQSDKLQGINTCSKANWITKCIWACGTSIAVLAVGHTIRTKKRLLPYTPFRWWRMDFLHMSGSRTPRRSPECDWQDKWDGNSVLHNIVPDHHDTGIVNMPPGTRTLHQDEHSHRPCMTLVKTISRICKTGLVTTYYTAKRSIGLSVVASYIVRGKMLPICVDKIVFSYYIHDSLSMFVSILILIKNNQILHCRRMN